MRLIDPHFRRALDFVRPYGWSLAPVVLLSVELWSTGLTRQRLAGMEDFMEVTNKIFQQFIGNAKSGLTKVVKVLLKAF